MLRTATAIAALLLVTSPAFAEDWGNFYAEVYGGAHTSGTSTYTTGGAGPFTSALDAGAAFGAAVGVGTPVPGLTLELDLMRTMSQYTGFPGSALDTTTLMVNAEYTIPLNELFEVYGAAGVGAYYLFYNQILAPVGTSAGFGVGVHVAVGGRVNVTENVALTA